MPAMFDSSVRVLKIKVGPDILVERCGQLRRIRKIVEFQRRGVQGTDFQRGALDREDADLREDPYVLSLPPSSLLRYLGFRKLTNSLLPSSFLRFSGLSKLISI